MSKSQSYEQLVGSYLDNEMSDKQRLDFDQQLPNNAELQQELSFQQEVIKGVKDFRMLELKARLDNVQIYTPIYQTIAFKVVAVIAITAGIGLGTYYLLNKEPESTSQKVELSYNQEPSVEDNTTATTPQVDENADNIKDQVAPPVTKRESRQQTASSKSSKREKGDPQTVVKQPEAIQPVVETFNDEELLVEDIDNLLSPSLENGQENISDAIEVATIKDKKNKFHYKFYENKLFLLGTFDEMPYEIIEVNSKAGKKFFLYYNNNYYKLQSDQVKPAPLEKIENDSLVNELKIIQTHKGQ